MSLLLLHQPLRRCQLSLLQRASGVVAVRFNSTSEDTRSWDSLRVDEQAPKKRLPTRDIHDEWRDNSEKFLRERSLAPRDAFTGRTVEIEGGDIAEAAKKLDRVLAQNAVSREWFMNRRHKQKGEERRRLISMRHRRRFSHEVGKMVQLVQEIRRKNS